VTKTRTQIQTPRVAQGTRPQYFADPNMDQMHAMILALATEVSVFLQARRPHPAIVPLNS
jgi:hypothetical protein